LTTEEREIIEIHSRPLFKPIPFDKELAAKRVFKIQTPPKHDIETKEFTLSSNVESRSLVEYKNDLQPKGFSALQLNKRILEQSTFKPVIENKVKTPSQFHLSSDSRVMKVLPRCTSEDALNKELFKPRPMPTYNFFKTQSSEREPIHATGFNLNTDKRGANK
jgi:hypothetical protein